MHLARAVRRLRSEGGWTIEEVAERSGLDPRHIQLVESGSSNPTLSTLVRVAEGLGTSLETLAAGLAAPPEAPVSPPARGRHNEPSGSTACVHRVKVERLALGVQTWTLLVLQGEPATTSRTRASRRQPK